MSLDQKIIEQATKKLAQMGLAEIENTTAQDLIEAIVSSSNLRDDVTEETNKVEKERQEKGNSDYEEDQDEYTEGDIQEGLVNDRELQQNIATLIEERKAEFSYSEHSEEVDPRDHLGPHEHEIGGHLYRVDPNTGEIEFLGDA